MVWYYRLAAIVGVLALAVLIVTYLRTPISDPLKDKALGNLVTIFFGAISGLSLKEIQGKHDRVLLLQFVADEYKDLETNGYLPGSDKYVAVEGHCTALIDRILGGS